MDILHELLEHGQSYWLDNLTRAMIRDGHLARRVREQGLRGVTSNPAIFHKAISSGEAYDDQIRQLALAGASIERMYEELVVTDIRDACDILRPVYDDSSGGDGFVSLEVSPYLMYDTEGSLIEARHLWNAVDRPNLMIKIPGTAAGVPAIEQLLYEGINVNITLLFAIEAYEEVARAHLRALARRLEEGLAIDTVASVASFFLSRIDVLVDRLLAHYVGAVRGGPLPQEMYGRAAVASARLAYRSFRELTATEPWTSLAASGARPQRLLWASTSTKNPLYDPVRYVEPLVGRDTVNTMPEVTIEAFAAVGRVTPDAVLSGVEEAEAVFADLAAVGIDMDAVNAQLLAEGAEKFMQPFDALLEGLATRRAEMREGRRADVREPAERAPGLDAALAALHEQRFARRLADRDPSLWSDDPATRDRISDRLGWMGGSEEATRALPDLQAFAETVRGEGIGDVVVLGMGGSSLCPLVAGRAFNAAPGYPRLHVLDDVDPAAVAALVAKVDLERTLFVVASKSGGTVETLSLYRLFHEWLRRHGAADPGRHFVAVTDPGSSLALEAERSGFRAVFEGRTDVGGRYSALTPFGLLPMALMGADAGRIVEWARQMEHECTASLPESANPAIRLGAALALHATSGRTELALAASGRLQAFPQWVEQLVAESTGKDGLGILPVTGIDLSRPEGLGDRQVLVHYSLAGDPESGAPTLDLLEDAGHPVWRITLPEPEALGGEFVRWEIAVATAGSLLGVNPFDEPDVAAAKRATSEMLETGGGDSVMEEDGVDVWAHDSRGEEPALSAALTSWLDDAHDARYVAVLGYFTGDAGVESAVARLRADLTARTGVSTTFGFGPRYLHSTGQLHKGGTEGGLYLILTADPPEDLPVPGSDYTLGRLQRAQALGDIRALRDRGRRVLHVNLGWQVEPGLTTLAEAIRATRS